VQKSAVSDGHLYIFQLPAISTGARRRREEPRC
jgi:hypothetical protein